MHLSTSPWVWVTALLTLAIYSYLYQDNPVYKFAEHLFVGVAAGYYLCIQYRNVLVPNLFDPLAAGPKNLSYFWLVVPLLLGLFLLTRLVSPSSWPSRWPVGLMVGAFSGLAIIGAAQGDLVSQIQANLLPIWDPAAGAGLARAHDFADRFNAVLWLFGNVLLIFGVLTTLVFFFFSTEHKGAVGATARVGIYFLMLSFGASYGFTVMSRISLLLDRLRFLYGDWLGFPIIR